MHIRLQQLKKKPYNLTENQIDWICRTLEGMTREEKIRQILCMITYTDEESYLKAMAAEGYGGLMCRTMAKQELVNTVTILQENARIPFLIAANMEAGMNQVCDTGTYVGCQMAIAATGEEAYASHLGRIIGEEARALGLNWAFAPVIDIDNNWRNPITNTRTYGSNPAMVAAMGSRYVTALQKHGVAACIKHFPGDGVDERDQHLVTSINGLDEETWMKTYGAAYRACIQAGALTVMIGHIMQPAWSRRLDPKIKDEDILPATLSKELLQGLLRKELGFNGTTITDSSAMAGFGCAMARKNALPLAIAAGCDMLLFTKNTAEDITYLTEGVEQGIITPERLDEAVINVLALKCALGLMKRKDQGMLVPNMETVNKVVACEEHLRIAKEVADCSVTLIKEEAGVLPVTPSRYPRILVYGKETGTTDLAFGVAGKAEEFVEKLNRLDFEAEKYVPCQGFEGIEAPMTDTTDRYDLLIYLASLATKSNQTVVRIEWAQPMGADCPIFIHEVPTIFISLENPYHLVDVPRIRTYINGYNSAGIVLDAVIEKLMGRSSFKGTSPVDAFCGKWDTGLF